MKPQNERPQLDAERLYLDPSLVFDEMERLRLARQVLCGIFAVSVGVFAAHAYWDKNEVLGQTFELVKIGALPLVTLVVSFYFPTSAAR
ncbi:hypothetical protein LL394_001364 [Serratia marcescens]|uniref:hypothetical protein n=1 Tax=Serratia TaxID=613 RepID=UPI001A2BE33E|nr:hypothetical protein [Serratia marcescens]MDP8620960.1 hypothetical protein [Serratia marcescens]HAT2904790.1 hypothetical protein [Serratia marcescens]HAT2909536.1 hypothetical protein [Serratia marcescens]HAT3742616.1 hypothetical protein [Serratia marcescens]HAT3783496.1 hypothetical protein [Serratia marcescens]